MSSSESQGEQQQQQQQAATRAYDMLMGWIVSSAMQAAVRLGLPDQLKDGPRSAHELAKELGADEGALLLLLRALCSVDVFQEVEVGVFANTDVGTFLRSDVPNSLHGFTLYLAADWVWRPWHALPQTITTGRPSFEEIYQSEFWSYMAAHPQEYTIFNNAMASYTELLNDVTVAGYDFSAVRRLVDVGGGYGSFLQVILQRYPHLQGVLFDLPPVVAQAQQILASSPVGERCTFVEGNFFQGVPQGADAYIMKHVLHDWTDEECIRILRNCREALAPDGRILIVEYVVPEPPQKPSPFLFVGLWMRINTPGGYERTEQQFRRLCEEAGLQLVGVHPTGAPDSILEARSIA
jgi:SAM-dependent methyltransferase